MKSFIATILLAIPALVNAQDSENSVFGMCADLGYNPEICQCAAQKLLDEVGEENYGIYQRVGQVYRAQLAEGLAMEDAWDAALRENNVELSVTNPIGQAHSAAIDACE